MIHIDVANLQRAVPVDRRQFRRAVRLVLRDAGIVDAIVSLAVVDDATIRQLHHRYLGKDTTTDVLSFVLEQDAGMLEGEIIVGAETACRQAPRFGWTAENELLLYVIHGALHLVGYDDRTPRKRALMHRRQSEYLARLGIAREEVGD